VRILRISQNTVGEIFRRRTNELIASGDPVSCPTRSGLRASYYLVVLVDQISQRGRVPLVQRAVNVWVYDAPLGRAGLDSLRCALVAQLRTVAVALEIMRRHEIRRACTQGEGMRRLLALQADTVSASPRLLVMLVLVLFQQHLRR
jgi:hypothetical protein